MRIVTCLLVLLFLAGVLDSCKQGCKDTHALNYDSTVKAENGTCLYCDSSSSKDGTIVPGTDFSAPVTDKHVLDFILSEDEFTNKGNGCKSLNKTSGSSCSVNLLVINRTANFVTMNFDIFFQSNNNSVFWQFSNNNTAITLSPRDTLNFGQVDTICSDFSKGTANVNFNASYF
ncbi:MAG: hypothetical protein JWO06_1254 [Bacteroidota bacterium]|nr:hypothetical protein [Bacteroidota bacterium]